MSKYSHAHILCKTRKERDKLMKMWSPTPSIQWFCNSSRRKLSFIRPVFLSSASSYQKLFLSSQHKCKCQTQQILFSRWLSFSLQFCLVYRWFFPRKQERAIACFRNVIRSYFFAPFLFSSYNCYASIFLLPFSNSQNDRFKASIILGWHHNQLGKYESLGSKGCLLTKQRWRNFNKW